MNPLLAESLLFSCAAFLMACAHGALAAAEAGLIRLRYATEAEPHLVALRDSAAVGRLLQRAARAGWSIRAAGLILALATGSLAVLAVRPLRLLTEPPLEGFAAAGLFGFAFIAAALLDLILSESLGRAIGHAFPRRIVAVSALPLYFLSLLGYPWRLLYRRIGKTLIGLLRGQFVPEVNPLDIQVQMRALGNEDAPAPSPRLRKIIANALQLSELEVSDILLPRNQVQYFDLFDSLEDNLAKARRTGHTRFPLCEGELDRCIGIIHVKDIFRFPGKPGEIDLRRIKRDIIRVPDTLKLEDALHRLLGLKMHMALVTDDFGGIAGVLTLERILEELVGDIQDEFDAVEESHDVVPRDDGTWTVSGLTPVHDLEETLGLDVENDTVSTFGGLITAELGRIPVPEEELTLEDPGLRVTIDRVDDRRIISTTVRVLPREAEGQDSVKSEED